MAKQNWISLKEAAEASGLSRQTIWRRCKDKTLATAVMVGDTYIVDRDEVVRYGEYFHSTEFDDENESDEVSDAR